MLEVESSARLALLLGHRLDRRHEARDDVALPRGGEGDDDVRVNVRPRGGDGVVRAGLEAELGNRDPFVFREQLPEKRLDMGGISPHHLLEMSSEIITAHVRPVFPLRTFCSGERDVFAVATRFLDERHARLARHSHRDGETLHRSDREREGRLLVAHGDLLG